MHIAKIPALVELSILLPREKLSAVAPFDIGVGDGVSTEISADAVEVMLPVHHHEST